MSRVLLLPFLCLLLLGLGACQDAGDTTAQNDVTQNSAPRAEGAVFQVYKSPTCGCCGDWVDHLKDHGLAANTHHPEDLNAFKQEQGIAPRYQSCHTAVSAQGYVFEGHVPARDIQQFLASPPDNALGLAVPGMPVGSPGMEMGDRFQPYDVLLLSRDGGSEVYRHVASAEQQ